MNIRTQISMDPAMRRRAHAKAAALGISFAEYVRRLVAQDLGDTEARGFAEADTKPKPDISNIFDLGASDEPTDVASDKDKLTSRSIAMAAAATGRSKSSVRPVLAPPHSPLVHCARSR